MAWYSSYCGLVENPFSFKDTNYFLSDSCLKRVPASNALVGVRQYIEKEMAKYTARLRKRLACSDVIKELSLGLKQGQASP